MGKISDWIKENLEVNQTLLESEQGIEQAANLLVNALKKGNKLLICGNGGSAADAQHISAELLGRFKKERSPLPAIALTTDTSTLTAWSNDYSFETVFARQIKALGSPGDVLVALSTSGNSKNIIKAIESARKNKLTVLTLTGKNGGKIKPLSDLNINVKSQNTPRIQESHQLIYHILCEMIDESF